MPTGIYTRKSKYDIEPGITEVFERICLYCKSEFYVKIQKSKQKYCCYDCYWADDKPFDENHWNYGRVKTEEEKKRISDSLVKHFQNNPATSGPDHHRFGEHLSKELICRQIKSRTTTNAKKPYGWNRKPKPLVGIKLKKKWSEDVEFRNYMLKQQAKGMKGARKTATRPEKMLLGVLKELDENWKWVGDGRYPVAGHKPDFVLIGTKKLILMNGDFWHANPEFYDWNWVHPLLKCTAKRIWEKDEKLKRKFLQYQHDCLIVWESELQNIEKLKEKIKKYLES